MGKRGGRGRGWFVGVWVRQWIIFTSVGALEVLLWVI